MTSYPTPPFSLALAGQQMQRFGQNLLGDVGAFRNEYKIFTLGAIAAIFTWGFVQALKINVLNPIIRAYLIPAHEERSRMMFHLRGTQFVDLGEFVAELIVWVVLMSLLFVIWRMSRSIAIF
jgi:large-conductance mechanosensitive channel